jgi:hypothetical protein
MYELNELTEKFDYSSLTHSEHSDILCIYSTIYFF